MFWKFWNRKKKIILCPQDVLTDLEVLPCTEPALLISVANVVKETDCNRNALPLTACEKCGACCAFFPVNFPDIEKDDLTNGTRLTEMSLPAGHLLRVMRGTECRSPRCAALEGEVGRNVRCSIYACRPSTCRNFNRSWEKDMGNTLCDRARAVYGMQPFSQY